MKKISNIWGLVIGIVLFLISYRFDNEVNIFFKSAKFSFFDIILSIITNFGVVILVILLIPSFLFYKNKKANKNLIYFIWLTSIVSFILAFIVKIIVQRERPIGLLNYPLTSIADYSFPSQHSIVVFSLLPILTNYLPRQKYFWIGFAFLIAFSRVYLGFHFLSDVVFGGFAGYFIGNYFLKLYEKGEPWR